MSSAVGRPQGGWRLGDFEILREVGRGGMGVVYEARQVSLNRRVALKVLGPGLGLTPHAVQRFRREAEAAARLHHTNIVPVYATGEQDGTHFYAMELIEGPSLNHVIQIPGSPVGVPHSIPAAADPPLTYSGLRHGRGGSPRTPRSRLRKQPDGAAPPRLVIGARPVSPERVSA